MASHRLRVRLGICVLQLLVNNTCKQILCFYQTVLSELYCVDQYL